MNALAVIDLMSGVDALADAVEQLSEVLAMPVVATDEKSIAMSELVRRSSALQGIVARAVAVVSATDGGDVRDAQRDH